MVTPRHDSPPTHSTSVTFVMVVPPQASAAEQLTKSTSVIVPSQAKSAAQSTLSASVMVALLQAPSAEQVTKSTSVIVATMQASSAEQVTESASVIVASEQAKSAEQVTKYALVIVTEGHDDSSSHTTFCDSFRVGNPCLLTSKLVAGARNNVAVFNVVVETLTCFADTAWISAGDGAWIALHNCGECGLIAAHAGAVLGPYSYLITECEKGKE